MVMEHGSVAEKNHQLEGDELMKLVTFGADQVFKSDEAIDDDDIEVIIGRGEYVSFSSNMWLHVQEFSLPQ